ncbi:uncharacterized protein PV06_03620 [Exophiala oligosperma]|uniref:Uncharacterized protein n=1 Tax=Exophiala oligosperma TaxID=215243 RepID=A0A0D2DQQ0_9EURO|nr:uncharacterized protein PV06_03620 [Exophiala oligosperma]KIW45218.1 hypothetical protein PV06_03620 [Exophiala oligosperma]
MRPDNQVLLSPHIEGSEHRIKPRDGQDAFLIDLFRYGNFTLWSSRHCDESTYGSGHEVGRIEIEAQAADIFVILTGLAHKIYYARPSQIFALLTLNDAH